MNKAYHISRILLGIIYLVFGLNGFINLIPVPELTESGSRFMNSLIETGYMLYFWKSIEVITGILFLLNRYVLLAGLFALPVTVNIFAFHIFLDQGNFLVGALVFIFNILILLNYKKHLKTLVIK